MSDRNSTRAALHNAMQFTSVRFNSVKTDLVASLQSAQLIARRLGWVGFGDELSKLLQQPLDRQRLASDQHIGISHAQLR